MGISESDINIDAVIQGELRLTPGQALHLYEHASLHDLGRWSTAMANRILVDAGVDPDIRTYVIDRNINYTNVCSAACAFCAFKRDAGDDDAYTLTDEQLHQKVQELVDIGGTQILLQGGMHPDLPIEFYEQMLGRLKRAFPQVHIHGFSPPEFVEFVAVFQIDGFPTAVPLKGHEIPWDVWCAKLDAILRRLAAAGLDSIPGGGAEIFAESVRKRIGRGKADARQWLEVMSAAHRLGMFTSATMMFGHIESPADRIDHMDRVRAAQDQAIADSWPGRYVSFVSWPFQPANTPLGQVRESSLHLAGATDYLRTLAVSRLFLDNIGSVGASCVTMGPSIGQLALFFGANDLGSVMMEENVVTAAGGGYCLDEQVLCHLIRTAGFLPAQRDNRYNLLKVHDGKNSADLLVDNWQNHRVGRS